MPKRTQPHDGAPSLPGATPPRAAQSASPTGTGRFVSRWGNQFVADFFRLTRDGLAVSSIGHGTYLGESDDPTDAMYAAALRHSLTAGVNMVDTAINYRCQRSERVIGDVLQRLIGEGALQRDEVMVCTKAGYIPLDASPPTSREAYAAYVQREYFDSGILRPEDVVGGAHSLAPRFLVDQLHRSLRNLRVGCLDVFYLHNPEQQLAAISPAELGARMRAAFAALEGCVETGLIAAYGCATWNGLRLPAGSQGHLSLYDVVAAAKEVAGDAHHLRMVQLPINLGMSEAVRVSTQRDRRGRLVRVLDAAEELGLHVVASAPLLQGQLTHDLPAQVRELFPGESDAQRALAFVRGLPGVLAAATGMREEHHVNENLRAFQVA